MQRRRDCWPTGRRRGGARTHVPCIALRPTYRDLREAETATGWGSRERTHAMAARASFHSPPTTRHLASQVEGVRRSRGRRRPPCPRGTAAWLLDARGAVEAVLGAEGPDLGTAHPPPAGAGVGHAVPDAVAAGPFDDAGRDRPAGGQGGGVINRSPCGTTWRGYTTRGASPARRHPPRCGRPARPGHPPSSRQRY